MQFVAELHRMIDVPSPPRRIISLVPSITETLFALGIGERVVGVTEYCTHPPDAVATVPKIGGTKNPQLETILALSPDIVIVNDEENRQEDFTWLQRAYPKLEQWKGRVGESAQTLADLLEFEKSLELNPKNQNAVEMLKRLR